MAKSTVTETRVFMHNTDMEGYAGKDDDVMSGSSRRPSASGWGSLTLGCCEDDDGAGQYNEGPSILLSSDNGNRPFRRSDQVTESGPAALVSGVDGRTAGTCADDPSNKSRSNPTNLAIKVTEMLKQHIHHNTTTRQLKSWKRQGTEL